MLIERVGMFSPPDVEEIQLALAIYYHLGLRSLRLSGARMGGTGPGAAGLGEGDESGGGGQSGRGPSRGDKSGASGGGNSGTKRSLDGPSGSSGKKGRGEEDAFVDDMEEEVPSSDNSRNNENCGELSFLLCLSLI